MNYDEADGILTEMVRFARTLRLAGQRSRENSLTGTKLGFLRHLVHRSARLSDLAHHHLVSLPVASRAVDGLEADGLVTRRPDPDDARATLIAITDTGRADLDQRQRRMTEHFAEQLAHWSDHDAAAAMRVLSELTDSIVRIAELGEVSGTPPNDSPPDAAAPTQT